MIARRLFAFNLLVLFLPAAAILYLDVYETRLLGEQERSMVQHGRLVAAALSDRDPIDAAAATEFLTRLGESGDARLRVYDARGVLIADSNRLRPSRDEAASTEKSYPATISRIRGRVLYKIGAWIVSVRQRIIDFVRPARARGVSEGEAQPARALHTALAGGYGSTTRPTPGQRSVTLFSAVPVRHGEDITGAVLVSQTTFRALQALYAVRLRIFEIILASVVAAAALTILAAATVVRPLGHLRREALALAERRARLPGEFAGVDRRDEIGDLARSLRELTERLDEHIAAVEQFAADVSHEFKNPLASIRSACEMAAQAEAPEDRDRFLRMLTGDVDRLERLVSGVRQLALVDRQVEQEPSTVVDAGELLAQVVDGLRRAHGDRATIAVRIGVKPAPVRATADHLVQVFENVLANALSFAPPASAIDVRLDSHAGGLCRVAICDRGPGIPAAHLDRIFERFFSYRPASAGDRPHTGLGLSIARTIVHGYGGTIVAENREGGGACVLIDLPLQLQV